MKMPEELPVTFLTGIKKISVDASSLIYMLKIGILGYAAAEMEMRACPCILKEVGWPHLPVKTVMKNFGSISNDDTVLALSEYERIPLLSEDYEILKGAEDRGIPYFNTLMILNYLLFRKRVTSEEYSEYLKRLKEISRYSQDILDYGEAIKNKIDKY